MFDRCVFMSFLQGAGTSDDTLIRVMVTRSEVDMLDIRAEFRKLFACSLHSMIKVREHIFKALPQTRKLLSLAAYVSETFPSLFSLIRCVFVTGRYWRRLPQDFTVALWWRWPVTTATVDYRNTPEVPHLYVDPVGHRLTETTS